MCPLCFLMLKLVGGGVIMGAALAPSQLCTTLLTSASSVGHHVASAQSCTAVLVHNPQCFEMELLSSCKKSFF